jgi:hypothetical protein
VTLSKSLHKFKGPTMRFQTWLLDKAFILIALFKF